MQATEKAPIKRRQKRTATSLHKSKAKQNIAEMYPIKKWLSLREACSFTDKSKDTFKKWAVKHKFNISEAEQTTFYLVAEINAAFEAEIFIKHST